MNILISFDEDDNILPVSSIVETDVVTDNLSWNNIIVFDFFWVFVEPDISNDRIGFDVSLME